MNEEALNGGFPFYCLATRLSTLHLNNYGLYKVYLCQTNALVDKILNSPGFGPIQLHIHQYIKAMTPQRLTSSWSTSLFSLPTLHRRFSLTRSTHRLGEHVNFFQWDYFTFISRHWLSLVRQFHLISFCSVCSLFTSTLTTLHVIEGSLLKTVVRIRLTNIHCEKNPNTTTNPRGRNCVRSETGNGTKYGNRKAGTVRGWLDAKTMISIDRMRMGQVKLGVYWAVRNGWGDHCCNMSEGLRTSGGRMENSKSGELNRG